MCGMHAAAWGALEQLSQGILVSPQLGVAMFPGCQNLRWRAHPPPSAAASGLHLHFVLQRRWWALRPHLPVLLATSRKSGQGEDPPAATEQPRKAAEGETKDAGSPDGGGQAAERRQAGELHEPWPGERAGDPSAVTAPPSQYEKMSREGPGSRGVVSESEEEEGGQPKEGGRGGGVIHVRW